MPSTVTVHYRFHPLHNRSLKVVAWPRRAGIAATVRDPGGKALKIPRWMLEPEAVHHRLGDRVELPVSVLRALAAQLPSCLKIPATPPPEHNDAANEPRSRHRSGCRRRSGDGVAALRSTWKSCRNSSNGTPSSIQSKSCWTGRRVPRKQGTPLMRAGSTQTASSSCMGRSGSVLANVFMGVAVVCAPNQH